MLLYLRLTLVSQTRFCMWSTAPYLLHSPVSQAWFCISGRLPYLRHAPICQAYSHISGSLLYLRHLSVFQARFLISRSLLYRRHAPISQAWSCISGTVPYLWHAPRSQAPSHVSGTYLSSGSIPYLRHVSISQACSHVSGMIPHLSLTPLFQACCRTSCTLLYLRLAPISQAHSCILVTLPYFRNSFVSLSPDNIWHPIPVEYSHAWKTGSGNIHQQVRVDLTLSIIISEIHSIICSIQVFNKCLSIYINCTVICICTLCTTTDYLFAIKAQSHVFSHSEVIQHVAFLLKVSYHAQGACKAMGQDVRLVRGPVSQSWLSKLPRPNSTSPEEERCKEGP